MLRRIKKWYFKIYHLFKLLGIFILIFGVKEIVYADECINLLPEYSQHHYNTGRRGTSYTYNSAYNENLNLNHTAKWTSNYDGSCEKENYFCLEEDKVYTFFVLNKENDYINLTELNKYPNKLYLTGKHKGQYTFPEDGLSATFTPGLENDTPIFQFSLTTETNIFDDVTFVLVEGENRCKPANVEDPVPEQNNVYSNFLTLYTDKISYLADGFTKNQYLLTMIGIIFSFVVLELFLKILHLKGGYRK